MAGLAAGTWVYQERDHSEADVTTNFAPSPTGKHYHQAVAPTSGDIDSGVWERGIERSRIGRADGGCGRDFFEVGQHGPGGWQLISDYIVFSGVGKAWVCDEAQGWKLPTCQEN